MEVNNKERFLITAPNAEFLFPAKWQLPGTGTICSIISHVTQWAAAAVACGRSCDCLWLYFYLIRLEIAIFANARHVASVISFYVCRTEHHTHSSSRVATAGPRQRRRWRGIRCPFEIIIPEFSPEIKLQTLSIKRVLPSHVNLVATEFPGEWVGTTFRSYQPASATK